MYEVRHVTDAFIYMGAFVGALTALGALLRLVVVKPLKAWIADQVKQPVDTVRSEMQPDRGTSMRESILRTETKIDTLFKRFDDHLLVHGRKQR